MMAIWPGDDAPFNKKLIYYTRCLLSSPKFEGAIGIVIVLNAISVGVETQLTVTGKIGPYLFYFFVLEWVFLGVYSFELALRFYAYGLKCLRSGWVIFDALLVFSGVFSLVLLPVMFM